MVVNKRLVNKRLVNRKIQHIIDCILLVSKYTISNPIYSSNNINAIAE